MTNQQMIQSDAMPQQVVPAFPANSNSPMTAGIIKGQQQAAQQNSLAKTGGYRRRRAYTKGGAASIQVPPVPAGTASPDATKSNYTDLTSVAQQQSTQMVYDSAKTPSDTSKINQQQQALYKGGSKKKGGSVRWGCFSGGRKTKRKGKNKKTLNRRKKRTTKRKH